MNSLARAALPPVLYGLEVIVSILLFIMIMLTFIDVVGRYLFASPVFGAAEMIEFLLATLIFSALGLVNARDEHITVEIFEHHFTRAMPRIHAVLVKGTAVVAMAIIAWQLAIRAADALHHNEATVVLEWPLYWVIGAVAFFSLLSLVLQLLGWFVIGEAEDQQMSGNG